MSAERRRFEDLAALCGAGAGTAADRIELDSVLAAHQDWADEARAYDDAAAALVLALDEAALPANGFNRIRERIASAARADAPVDATVISLAERRRRRALAAAALALAAAAVFCVLWLKERDEARGLRVDVAELQSVGTSLHTELVRSQRELAALRDRFSHVRAASVKLVSFGGAADGRVRIFVEPSSRRWLVFAYELPPITSEQDYQLWFLPESGAPIPAGLLRPDPDGVLTADVKEPAAGAVVRAAVSLEPRGGSATPTEVKLIGDLI
jgi:anti-sigma-K factor RskA